MSSFNFITQEIAIYYGIPVLVAGVLGGVLNSIIFLSLRTFRQSPCAFYLTIMSMVNIGQLFTGLLSRIMISGFNIDWTGTSLFYCKFRYFLLQTCTLISLTCICLATIDQYFATCSHPRWQQWSHLKVAHHLTIVFAIIWSLHGVLYLIFNVQVYSPITQRVGCKIIDSTFGKYQAYGYSLILTGFLPISITVIFALMAFRNIKQMTYRAVPFVRRELEKQLTRMVLIQVAVNCFALLPNNIVSALETNTAIMSDPNVATRIQFASVISILICYLNFASPFYIYICVSERFRRQFIYVMFEMHLNRSSPPKLVLNQVVPMA